MAEPITKWKAEDGSIHDSEGQALNHEQTVARETFITRTVERLGVLQKEPPLEGNSERQWRDGFNAGAREAVVAALRLGLLKKE